MYSNLVDINNEIRFLIGLIDDKAEALIYCNRHINIKWPMI